jgi:hypothetical protein
LRFLGIALNLPDFLTAKERDDLLFALFLLGIIVFLIIELKKVSLFLTLKKGFAIAQIESYR